jgi:hypothetical protein
LDNSDYGTEISIDYFITILAKALCFERFIAVNRLDGSNMPDPDEINQYYEERSELYDEKAIALLELVGINLDFEDVFEDISETHH